MNPWYLLYCKRSEQQRAEQHLTRQGIDCYYPQVTVNKLRRGKIYSQLEPLFPSYVFASFDPEQIAFTTVRSTRGVVDFVRQGSIPVKVPLEIVQNVMLREEHDLQRVKSRENLQLDDNNKIFSEISEGEEALYMEPLGEKRAILLINMINQKAKGLNR